MKVAATFDLPDLIRNDLAVYIDGKVTKRLATRDEVRDFLTGVLLALPEARNGAPDRTSASTPLDEQLEANLAKLREEGRNDSFIAGYRRGWEQVK